MSRLVALCLVLAACEQPRTEMIVGVVTDINAPNVIDGAQLVVTRVKDGFVEQQVSWEISGAPNQPFNLPGSYGVYSDGDEVKLDIVLTGLKGANPIVNRRAVLNLVEGKTLFFRMSMTVGCASKTDCLANQTCVEGVCTAAELDARQLPDFQPELVNQLTCNSGTAFIDTATGAPLPMSPDATDCPADLCVEGTCRKPVPSGNGDVEPDPRPMGDGGTTSLPDGGTGASCGPGTCGGCCLSPQLCTAGDMPNACGSNGNACVTCAGAEQCISGICM